MELPTSGPLGKKESYDPTNRDLLNNAYEQNKSINKQSEVIGEINISVKDLDGKVQTLSTTVASHSEVINQLTQIKAFVIWILSFVGMSGLLSFLNYLRH